ncbi:MAG TPA: 4Fe-4S dicluster domain-containing protein [Desulfuromonadales bacterium]|nr:4Fe-4S dicluster domain-containing protein [Desulfuromonadales bacterium]
MSFICIDDFICKGCGLCTAACPHNLISLRDLSSSNGYSLATFSGDTLCSGCALCAQMCPDVAITVFNQ